MIHIIKTVATLSACMIIISCGTILGGDREVFLLDSEPPGATVKRSSGRLLGYTPLNFSLPRTAQSDSSETVVLSMPGYQTAKVKITPEFNTATLLNGLFSSTLLGAPSSTTDQLNGKVYRYEEGSYVVEMRRKINQDVRSREEPQESAALPQQNEMGDLSKEPKVKDGNRELERERKELERQQMELEHQRRELERQREQLELDRERIKLEGELERQQEREIERQQERQPDLNRKRERQGKGNLDHQLPSPNRENSRSKEDQLIEEMKQRYKEQLKRRDRRQRLKNGIEITPLSLVDPLNRDDSPSYGALELSITRFQAIQEELARGEGESLKELYLRLSLALDESLDPLLVARVYPHFIRALRHKNEAWQATHGLQLFRVIKPIQEGLISLAIIK